MTSAHAQGTQRSTGRPGSFKNVLAAVGGAWRHTVAPPASAASASAASAASASAVSAPAAPPAAPPPAVDVDVARVDPIMHYATYAMAAAQSANVYASLRVYAGGTAGGMAGGAPAEKVDDARTADEAELSA